MGIAGKGLNESFSFIYGDKRMIDLCFFCNLYDEFLDFITYAFCDGIYYGSHTIRDAVISLKQ